MDVEMLSFQLKWSFFWDNWFLYYYGISNNKGEKMSNLYLILRVYLLLQQINILKKKKILDKLYFKGMGNINL